MTSELAHRTCTPCRGGVPPMSEEEARRRLADVAEWQLDESASRIERTFRFKSFKAAYALVCQVSDLAEKEGHHPDIRLGWGYAGFTLWTHKIKGLHLNDFIMAAKIDELAQSSPQSPG